MEKTKKIGCVVGLLAVIASLSLIPLVQAQAQPPLSTNECMAYAYTKSGDHAFLLENNSFAYGTNIFIRTNCEELQLKIDGEPYSLYRNQTQISFSIESPMINMTLESGNFSYYAENVSLFQDRFTWSDNYIQYLDDQPKLTFIEFGKLTFQENVVSVASIVVVWFLSVNIYWSLINHYLDRNLFEEVVE
jgi:hypothetical protein